MGQLVFAYSFLFQNIWVVNNKIQIIWYVSHKELRTLHMSYENSYHILVNLSYGGK
jgi:hypothetical protein